MRIKIVNVEEDNQLHRITAEVINGKEKTITTIIATPEMDDKMIINKIKEFADIQTKVPVTHEKRARTIELEQKIDKW